MPQPDDARTTLDTVAAAVGVSKATVSKVLNDRPGVSDATRQRVTEAFERLGYSPTTRARYAASHRRVAVVFDTLANLYALRMLDGLIAEAQVEGVEIVPDIMSPLDPGPGRSVDESRVRDLHARGFDGLLVITTQLSRPVLALCARLGLAVVAVDPPDALDPDVASVGSNNWSGGFQATEHLVSLGHRRIGFVGGSATHAGLRERRSGYRAALEAAGLTEDAALISEAGMGSTGSAAVAMLAHADPPTAFFVSSDPGALSVLREIVRAGRRVPDDVSIVGYDDTYATLPAPVQLTTVHTPITEIASVALATLTRMLDGLAPVSNHLQLSTTLALRESTAVAPLPQRSR